MPTYPRPSDTAAIRTKHAHTTTPDTDGQRQARRAGWLRALHQWHWISSAVSLFGMLMFALTGITLNHSGAIEAKPRIETRSVAIPASLRDDLRTLAGDGQAAERPLPDAATRWVADAMALSVAGKPAEWSEGEIYLALPRPGVTPGCISTLRRARQSTNSPTAAGSPGSTTCTRVATRVRPGAGSSTSSRWRAWSSP